MNNAHFNQLMGLGFYFLAAQYKKEKPVNIAFWVAGIIFFLISLFP